MRLHLFHRFRHGLLRHLAVWAVVLTVPINGMSNLLLHLLGPQHHHAPAGWSAMEPEGEPWSFRAALAAVVGRGAMDLIDGFHAKQRPEGQRFPMSSDFQPHVRTPDAQVLSAATLPAVPAMAHVHSHDGSERHRHDPRDGSVVPLGATDAGQDGPGTAQASLDVGGALPVPAFASIPAPMAAGGRSAWASLASPDWRSHVSPPQERPPRA